MTSGVGDWPQDENGTHLDPDMALRLWFEEPRGQRADLRRSRVRRSYYRAVHYEMLIDGLADLIAEGRLNCRRHTDYDWICRMVKNAGILAERMKADGKD